MLKYLMILPGVIGFTYFTYAQDYRDTVKLDCSNHQLTIPLDTIFKVERDSYEEGLFWTVLTGHADVFEVRCGGLQSDSYLEDPAVYKVIEKCTSDSRVFYKGINIQTNLPWILVKFPGSKFVVSGRSMQRNDGNYLYKIASNIRIQ